MGGTHFPKEDAMNKDELKGKMENLKGRAKEATGAITGDKEKQAEGTVERVRGAAREKIAEAKENIAKKVEKIEETEEGSEEDERTDEEP
jgi:uncharacterized protein YjbJ (UPF0337 family)